MLLAVKILVLLWLINLVPPLLAHFLENRWNHPLDGGRNFRDGYPYLGPHKTIRGVVSAVAVGGLTGVALSFPLWVGLSAGVLSMAGDLLSSFIKRRMGMASGSIVPGLDQVFEGFIPFLVLGPAYELNAVAVFLLLLFFGVGAYAGSWFFKGVLGVKPFDTYPRSVRSIVRLRELRRCQVTSHPFHHLLNFEDSFYYHIVMKSVFRVLNLYERGKENALQLERRALDFHFPDLPRSFDGYSVLFLADLHLDGLEGLTERLQDILRGESVDLCVIGGDFRMDTHGPFHPALDEVRRILPEIRSRDGILAVLGNHDCMEIVEPLEEMGIKFLINEARAVERNGEKIWIVGVDDPHYFKCHDLETAFSGVPREDFSVFVAHSNEVYEEAAPYSPRLYLCGHTHAGQIRLPYLGPVFTHSKAPRRFSDGLWQYGSMRGYTTCGVGASGVPLRFASRGEVVVMTLRRGEPEKAN